jgi:hypothetical protein
MPPPRRPMAAPAILSMPVVYRVGEHALRIGQIAEGRWNVSVDGGPVAGPYATQVEAWEAGVRLADSADRRPPG